MSRFWIPRVTLDKNGNLTTWNGELTGIFKNIKTISDYGLYNAFYSCTRITGSISFPALTSIGDYGLYYAFYNCNGITGSINFPALTSVGSSGLNYAFYSCNGITGSVSFPALTSVGSSGLYNAFYSCTGITSIHFRADAKSVIEAESGYSNKFGASNATIYFDL